MKKKRIRFLINSLSGGGAENILLNVLSFLSKNSGYDVYVQTVVKGKLADRIPEGVHFKSIFEHCRETGSIPVKIVLKLPRAIFCKLFLRGDYDYEVAYLEGRPTRFLAAKNTNGKKLAFVHCDLSVKNMILPLYRNVSDCRDEYSGFDTVCFVSADALKSFESTIGALPNAKVVHNIIDINRINTLKQQDCSEGFKTGGFKLIAVGRLAAEKNYKMLISVIGELEKDYELELLILGEGAEREELEAEIRDNGIRSVRLAGFKDNPYPLIDQADALVCSSLFEGYSTVACEAIALGVPVITTACAGMDEILDGGRFGSITENSRQGLLDGLKKLLSDPSLLEQYKHALREYSPNTKAESEYTELFNN